jgi:hypothetical protein
MALLREVQLDPTDATRTRGWALYGSGYIENFGGAPAANFDIPEGFSDASAQSFNVVDPVTPAGYVLSWTGAIFTFGGATPAVGNTVTGGAFPIWRRLVMNPAGNGQGYQMDVRGRIFRFGSTLPSTLPGWLAPSGSLAGGAGWTEDIGVDMVVDWTTKKWAVLSVRGDIIGSTGFMWGPGDTTYRPYYADGDVYRAIEVLNWTPASPQFYVASRTGRTYALNGAPQPYGAPYYADRDLVRDLKIVSASSPLELEQDYSNGVRRRWIVSSPPSATVSVFPASPVTTTTRPSVAWVYNDPDSDRQAEWDVRVYPEAGYAEATYDDTDDFVFRRVGTDAETSAVDIDVDLPNGEYRAYVWVTDAAGQRSDTAYTQFDINVVRPGTPSLAVSTDLLNMGLRVTGTGGSPTPGGSTLVVEASDDGNTWEVVWGSGETFPIGTVDFVDVEIPFNSVRYYRAKTVRPDPYIASAYSATVEGTLTFDGWVLSDPRELGAWVEILVHPDFRILKDTGAVKYNRGGGVHGLTVYSGAVDDELSIPLWALNRASYEGLAELLFKERVLLLRDPWRRAWFGTPIDQVELSPIKAGPEPGEDTSLRYAQTINLTFVQTERPDPAGVQTEVEVG